MYIHLTVTFPGHLPSIAIVVMLARMLQWAEDSGAYVSHLAVDEHSRALIAPRGVHPGTESLRVPQNLLVRPAPRRTARLFPALTA